MFHLRCVLHVSTAILFRPDWVMGGFVVALSFVACRSIHAERAFARSRWVADIATVAAIIAWLWLRRRGWIAVAIFFRPDWVVVGVVVAHSFVACQRISAVSVGTRRPRVADVATVAAIIERLWRHRRRGWIAILPRIEWVGGFVWGAHS